MNFTTRPIVCSLINNNASKYARVWYNWTAVAGVHDTGTYQEKKFEPTVNLG